MNGFDILMTVLFIACSLMVVDEYLDKDKEE